MGSAVPAASWPPLRRNNSIGIMVPGLARKAGDFALLNVTLSLAHLGVAPSEQSSLGGEFSPTRLADQQESSPLSFTERWTGPSMQSCIQQRWENVIPTVNCLIQPR